MWLTADDSNIHVWTHWLDIAVPHNVSRLTCSLSYLKLRATVGLAGIYADGGENGDGPEKIGDQFSGILAYRTGLIMAHLHDIPNQPAYFTAEKPAPRRRVEDALIAYGWSHFINDTSKPEWLPRLPMVKSVIKAMYGFFYSGPDHSGMPWPSLRLPITSGNSILS